LETVVFSCAVGERVASVCAAQQAETHRYLQYRYGMLGRPELMLPSIDQPPGFNTDSMAYFNYIGDGNGFIRFKNGRYSYIVYAFSSRQNYRSKDSAPGWNNWHGVVIEYDGKTKRVLRCDASLGVQSEIDPAFLNKNANFLRESNDGQETLSRVNDVVTSSKPR
jgi:hypothetical protein